MYRAEKPTTQIPLGDVDKVALVNPSKGTVWKCVTKNFGVLASSLLKAVQYWSFTESSAENCHEFLFNSRSPAFRKLRVFMILKPFNWLRYFI